MFSLPHLVGFPKRWPFGLAQGEQATALQSGLRPQGNSGHFSMIPTIEADIRFAIVPASMARMPRRASSGFLLGASAPMPPICIPMELRFAKPQSANVAIVNDRSLILCAANVGP